MTFEDLDKLNIETKKFWIEATKLCRSIESINSANEFLKKIKTKMQTKHFNLIGRKSRFNSLREILTGLTEQNILQVLNQIGTLPSRVNTRIPSYFIISVQNLYSRLKKNEKDNNFIESLKNSLLVLAYKLKTGKISTDIKKHLKDGYTKSCEILEIKDPINLKDDGSNLKECLEKLKKYNLKWKIYEITSFLEIATEMLNEILLEEKMMKNAQSIGNKKTVPNKIDGGEYLSSSAMKNQFEYAQRKVKKYWQNVEKLKFSDSIEQWEKDREKNIFSEIQNKIKNIGIESNLEYNGKVSLYLIGIVMHRIDELLKENKLSYEKRAISNFLRIYFECVVKNNAPNKELYGMSDKGKKLWNVENGTPKLSEDDLKQGNIGDCYLIATLMGMIQRNPDSLLKCFPNLSKEVDENGRSKTGVVTVRLHQVVLTSDSILTSDIADYTMYAAPTKKCMDIKIKFSTVLNIWFTNYSNDSKIFWPNFIEQAVTVARNIKNMVMGGGLFNLDTIIDRMSWQQNYSNLKVIESSTACAVIKAMLIGEFAKGKHDSRLLWYIKKRINNIMKSKNSKDYMHSVIKEKYIKKYTKKELEIFEIIKRKINSRKVVTVSAGFNEIKKWKPSDEFERKSKDWDGTIRKFRSDFDLKNKTSFFESQKFFNNHEYTVENYSFDRENGEIKIILRNPWNSDKVEGGKRVVLDLKKFCQYFSDFEYT